MRLNAISLANYFIDIASSNRMNIYQIGLMKRVYFTHGFCLAILNKSALDPRFDVVEAWKNGPVIPSVYHSFKHFKDNNITEKSFFVTDIKPDGEIVTETPILEDIDVKKIAEFVWRRYLEVSDFDLVQLTHRKGTPWFLCYKEGTNNPIPDLYTELFYKKLIKK
ncbi:MAG: DUF4065 domain-containing protein [Marinilabiliaceae bacterium]|nr:DUF4065 domain-containing protein [Marinilabiliaceae bacterium]